MMERATGASYDPETEIIVTSSGAEALNNTIHAFVGEGDEVIIPTPAFVSYKNLVKFTGAAVVEVPLSPGECFFIDDLHLNVEAARWCGMRAFHYQNDISRLRAALREAGIPVASER